MALSQDRKKALRTIGHKLNPIVTVAGNGLSENVLIEIDRALEDHELIKIKYLHFGNNLLDQKELIRQFKSDDYEDLIALENLELNFKAFNLNDSTWIKLTDVLLKIPKFKEEPRDYLLKKSKYIQKEDSLGLYLVAVKDALKRNDIAPKNYIAPTIKQMILHKRKLELIRDIEKTLLNDAIQNKNFKEY